MGLIVRTQARRCFCCVLVVLPPAGDFTSVFHFPTMKWDGGVQDGTHSVNSAWRMEASQNWRTLYAGF